MSAVSIRLAGIGDVGAIAAMLRHLAEELGDGEVFASTEETIRSHGFGPKASFETMIADTIDSPLGMALFFRHFSTTRGQAGVYIQDLWIAPEARGRKLGERLLASVASHAATSWEAEYLALTVHAANTGAGRFYERLGFVAHSDAKLRILPTPAFEALERRAEPQP